MCRPCLFAHRVVWSGTQGGVVWDTLAGVVVEADVEIGTWVWRDMGHVWAEEMRLIWHHVGHGHCDPKDLFLGCAVLWTYK